MPKSGRPHACPRASTPATAHATAPTTATKPATRLTIDTPKETPFYRAGAAAGHGSTRRFPGATLGAVASHPGSPVVPKPRPSTALAARLGLSPASAARLGSLRTPARIQDFVNRLRWNHERNGPTARSVNEVLRHGEAHCVEGALVAACALSLAGDPPLLMDMGAARGDVDHVVALFRRGGHWGAISKSNSPFLRHRDPIYRSLRELALSFFPQYVKKRRKTLRTYSVAVDLRRHDPALWVGNPGFCRELVDALTAARHFDILPPGMADSLRPIDEIEARSNLLRDHDPRER